MMPHLASWRWPSKRLATETGKDEYSSVEDVAFEVWLAGELAALPGVLGVALGGSRAQGTHRPDSDWDYALYYRGPFDPGCLRAKAWPGQVSKVGGWGDGVMSGGAWLTVEGRRVDVHYRDLDEVEHWCAEAAEGRFNKELLLFYAAGIPTYVVMAELAINRVLAGVMRRERECAPGPRSSTGGRARAGACVLPQSTSRARPRASRTGAGVGVPALFQPDVVVDRDLGRRGFFLAPQARRKA